MADLVMFGTNRVGERIYDWLVDEAENADVLALITDDSQYDTVEQLEPDLIVSSGFRHIVPEWVLDIPEYGAINCHLAYLPHNRGMNPNVWSIINDTPAGVSLHYMTNEIDAGPVIDRQQVDIEPDDTGKSLYYRLERAMFRLFIDNWNDIENDTDEPISISKEDGEYHYQRKFVELCELDRNETVDIGDFIDRLRALSFPPYNNAYFKENGEKYYVDISINHEDGVEAETIHWNMPEYDD